VIERSPVANWNQPQLIRRKNKKVKKALKKSFERGTRGKLDHSSRRANSEGKAIPNHFRLRGGKRTLNLGDHSGGFIALPHKSKIKEN